MKEKDISFIKIIQLISKNKKIKMGGKGGIYEYFSMKPNKKGEYENKGTWPFAARSLSRYLDELCDIGILKCEIEGIDRVFLISDDKYMYSVNIDKDNLKNILRVLMEKKQMYLFNKINLVTESKELLNDVYNEKKIDRLLSRVNIPQEDVKVNKNIEEKIKVAICESRTIEIIYKHKKYNIIPIAIVKSIDKNKKYLFYLRKKKIGEPFDLLNITEVEVNNKVTINTDEYLNSIKNRWDIDGGYKTEVEVLFLDNNNVMESVKRDLKYREGYKLYKVENGYVYQDKVEGINDFKRWIRKYSNNCIIIQPQQLKNEMLNSNSGKLNRYEVNFNV